MPPRSAGWSRRDVLRASGTAAALAIAGVVAAACGDDAKSKSPSKPVRDIPGRPPDAKTSRRKHDKPQASASRSREPLPAPLREYVASKHRDGALVKNDKSNVVHHPVLCRTHLAGKTPPPRKHKKPRASRPSKKPATRRKPHAEVVVHDRYADGILYALLRDEKDAKRRMGLALTAALAWPVSVHFADLALAGMKKDEKPAIDEAAVKDALASVAPTGTDPARRASDAVALLKARIATRAAQKDRPKGPSKKRPGRTRR